MLTTLTAVVMVLVSLGNCFPEDCSFGQDDEEGHACHHPPEANVKPVDGEYLIYLGKKRNISNIRNPGSAVIRAKNIAPKGSPPNFTFYGGDNMNIASKGNGTFYGRDNMNISSKGNGTFHGRDNMNINVGSEDDSYRAGSPLEYSPGQPSDVRPYPPLHEDPPPPPPPPQPLEQEPPPDYDYDCPPHENQPPPCPPPPHLESHEVPSCVP